MPSCTKRDLRAAKEREEAITAIHKVSQKFVPNEFIKSLGKDRITEVSLGDLVEKEVTVMFVDIRDFTSISENLKPKDNFLFINSFNKRMGPIIRKNEGFIMQYLGDGFMALFPNGAQNALRAAVEMNKELKRHNSMVRGSKIIKPAVKNWHWHAKRQPDHGYHRRY